MKRLVVIVGVIFAFPLSAWAQAPVATATTPASVQNLQVEWAAVTATLRGYIDAVNGLIAERNALEQQVNQLQIKLNELSVQKVSPQKGRSPQNVPSPPTVPDNR